MQEFLDHSIESSASYTDFMVEKDHLGTGELFLYVKEKCPFILRMFHIRGQWKDWNNFAYNHLGRIDGAMKRITVPWRKNKAVFFDRNVIDSIERSYAITSVRALKEGHKSASSEFTTKWARDRGLAYRVQAEWAVEVILEKLGYVDA